MTTTSQKKYAICDNSIAILKEESNACGVVYIYPIRTIDDMTNERKARQYFNGYDYKFDNNLDEVKMVCYSQNPIENSYSTMFMSLSKDGSYLAISWLPNPRLGPNMAMKYCTVYDLKDLQPCKIADSINIILTMPVRIIEFYGGCSFTAEENKLVLLNQDEVRVYALIYNPSLRIESFELEFSLDLSNTSASLSPAYNYDNKTPTYFLFPLGKGGSTNVIPQVIVPKHPVEYQSLTNSPTNSILDDDIFFNIEDDDEDKENDEWNTKDEDYIVVKNHISLDQDQDDSPSDVEHKDNIKQQDVEQFSQITEASSDQSINIGYHIPLHHQLFDKNNEFIKMNMDNIQLYNVICCVSTSSLQHTESHKNNLYVWSLNNKKMIHYNQLRDDSQYLTAFSRQLNLVAIAKKYDENNNLTRLVIEPAVHVYDCKSGIVVVTLSFPQNRSIAGITQVLFLQKDSYIMTVSFSYNECYVDIWDLGTGMHLDCCTSNVDHRKVFVQESQFVLHNNIQLKYGCGVFIRAEIPQELTETDDTHLKAGTRELCIQRVRFFETKYNHACQCQSTKFWNLTKPNPFTGQHVLHRRKDKTLPDANISSSATILKVAYFLDQNETYLMTCYNKGYNRHTFFMTIWRVTAGVSCRRKTDSHKRMVKLNNVVYSFRYSTAYAVSGRTAGYPDLLLNLQAAIQRCISHINPVVVTPLNSTGLPVLLIRINDELDMTNYSLVAHQEPGDNSHFFSYTVAIPLHAYSLIECHLNVLAYGDNSAAYIYETFTKIPNIVSGENKFEVTLESNVDLLEADYFGTLTGYTTLCRLAQDDLNCGLLEHIFETTANINYCFITMQRGANAYYITDMLREALCENAIQNARLIVSHLRHSISTSGMQNGAALLLENRLLIAQHNL
ncbi:uncharacterized protein EV154DRAFT_187031 [Mucor mucedo]|uniref:uncharacterized protein n=1 Tax=Mucor mucedo TaxID=29922 RepID=UPI002220C07B|nr:uncharacterized protein EV154DRAFT_187031 [Mucor mucedo]KAI7892672.1 hypothetical protein EV154DRAFT_187031 [Mucor mucedo]